jgi:hypothetical protein
MYFEAFLTPFIKKGKEGGGCFIYKVMRNTFGATL